MNGLTEHQLIADYLAELPLAERSEPRHPDGCILHEKFGGCGSTIATIGFISTALPPSDRGAEMLTNRPQRRVNPVELTGINLNSYAARAAAKSTSKQFRRNQVTGYALAYQSGKPVYVVLTSLMAHHLEDEETTSLLRSMEATAQLSWYIYDLKRSEFTGRLFGWLGRIVGWHRVAHHGGQISFRRAFRREDWMRLLTAADAPQQAATLEHRPPERLCLGRWK